MIYYEIYSENEIYVFTYSNDGENVRKDTRQLSIKLNSWIQQKLFLP